MALFEHIFTCECSENVGINSRLSRFWACLGVLALMVGVVFFARPVMAQTELSSAQARTAQFVFIIDDSGSMRVKTREGPAADPERLAVFGARSMLSMLDDSDEAAIVRLNGPADGESLMPIAALSENRKTLEGLLSLDGEIAKYPGKHTPCDSAMAAVKKQLNAAHRPNVMQVVIFLTDGECTGKQPVASDFLKGLRAHQDGAFQFYLLRWRGREYSKSLVTLAHETHGVASVVGAEDPTDILAPFASVLSRSQGYEAYVLTPASHVLEAHKGARRMRLLAVAPDKGQALAFSINATVKGEKPKVLGAARKGVHQYEGGKRYRYAALDYLPGTTPVTIEVSGAGKDWKVIAIPEYRLFVDMKLSEGKCGGSAGEDVHYVEVGKSICATVELVNQDGELVTADVAGRGTEAKIMYTAPGAGKAVALPASRSGDAPRFVFERANLSEGDYIFTPIITLTPTGSQSGVEIRGASRALQASSQRIVADPARLDFSALVPGAEQHHEISFRGNFSSGRGRLVVAGRKDVPDCVTFSLSGVVEGEGQTIHAGQPYSLAVHVAPYCGPTAFQRALDSVLHVEFDRSANAQAMPSVVIPFKGQLNNQIGLPSMIATTIEAGKTKDVNVRLRGNSLRDLEFEAMLPPVSERSDWPGKDLSVVFVGADGKTMRDEAGKPVLSQSIVFEHGELATDGKKSKKGKAGPLRVRVFSEICCGGGTYSTELVLVPAIGSRVPIRMPVEVTVEEAGLWSCWGPTILRVLLGLFVLLILLYLFNMYRNSRFLRRDALASRIVPLLWDDFGEARPNTRAAIDVQKMLRRDLSRKNRAVAWLKANPLRFGLPGGAYNECCELVLDQSANVMRSSVRHREGADYFETISKNPRQGLAKIYVSARGGTTFFTVKAEGSRVGTFFIQDDSFGFDSGFEDEDEFVAKVTTLRRATELHVLDSQREPDTMAGWRVG